MRLCRSAPPESIDISTVSGGKKKTQIITASSTTTGVNITAAADEFIYIAEGVTRASSADNGLSATVGGAEITVAGSLVAENNGMLLEDTNDTLGFFDVTIAPTGSVVGGERGIFISDNSNSITNYGFIGSDNHSISNNNGSGLIVNNAGTIRSSDQIGVYNFFGSDFRLSNTGTISSGGNIGVESTGSGGEIVNYGLIETTSSISTVYGVSLRDSDLNVPVGLINHGTIFALGGNAYLGDSNDTEEVENFGIVQGSVNQSGGDDYLLNDGIIHGDVIQQTNDATPDNDIVINTGEIWGDVNLGDGVDIYDGASSDGFVAGRVNGGDDSDSLFGSSADDDLRGDNQSDLIEGNGGNDDLLGGQGQDVIRGGEGNDRLFGQSNGDSLDGGAGLDRLIGGLANDTFIFKQGNDVDIIDDFANNGIEKVDLTDWAAVDAQAAIDGAYQVGNQVRINFGEGDMLALNGITVADLDASDFIFA